MKVHELIARLHEINPTGDSEVQLRVILRWGSRMAELDDLLTRNSDGIVIICEKDDEET